MKMIAKHFSSSSASVLLEKVIRKIMKCSGMKLLWGNLSLVKLRAILLKKNFSIYFFPQKFRKMSTKKKLSEKLLTGLSLMNIFKDTFQKLIKLTCRSLSKQSFSKYSEQMYNVESSGKYFSFCPSLIRRSHSCLISFRLFDVIWWKLRDGFFP